jgi:hypothetical protein
VNTSPTALLDQLVRPVLVHEYQLFQRQDPLVAILLRVALHTERVLLIACKHTTRPDPTPHTSHRVSNSALPQASTGGRNSISSLQPMISDASWSRTSHDVEGALLLGRWRGAAQQVLLVMVRPQPLAERPHLVQRQSRTDLFTQARAGARISMVKHRRSAYFVHQCRPLSYTPAA